MYCTVVLCYRDIHNRSTYLLVNNEQQQRLGMSDTEAE